MTTLYCTIKDLENRLSAEGVSARSDDEPPDDLGDCINDASTQIDEHLYFLYDPAQLATSDWVRQRCADVAAFLLCERRGNPPPVGIAKKYERAMERLEMVQLGQLAVPALPVRKELAPVLSNVRVRLDPFPRVVVERSHSTGTPEGYQQNTDSLDWNFDYSI